MNIIAISNIAGRIPTVNQLAITETGLGYNRKDALFFGIKEHADGHKTVECLGESITPGLTHDRLHDITSLLDHNAMSPAEYGGKILIVDSLTGGISFTDIIDGGNH